MRFCNKRKVCEKGQKIAVHFVGCNNSRGRPTYKELREKFLEVEEEQEKVHKMQFWWKMSSYIILFFHTHFYGYFLSPHSLFSVREATYRNWSEHSSALSASTYRRYWRGGNWEVGKEGWKWHLVKFKPFFHLKKKICKSCVTLRLLKLERSSRLQSPWDPFSKEPFSLILPLAHIFLVASGEPK